MIKHLTIYLAGLVATIAMIACNDTKNEDIDITYSSTQVKSFSLAPDDSLLVNLDSVYFSIDLVDRLIFNADSLPYGTPTDQLAVLLTTDACSTIELKYKTKAGKDTTVNYMTHSTQKINFSNGPVTLHLISYDQKAEQNYTLKVNVHTMVPDSLYWDEMSTRRLPSSFSRPVAQKTVKYGETAYCLSTNGTTYSIAKTDDPDSESWVKVVPRMNFAPDVESFSATDEALYILDTKGNLYRSADGSIWNAAGCKFTHLYGAYAERLLGVATGTDGMSHHATYSHPRQEISAAPIGDCPVKGTSQPAMFDSKWSEAPQLTIVGGRTADGELSSSSWGYDGKTWAKLSDTFPVKAEGVNLVPYIVTQTDSANWSNSRLPALLAFGGRTDKAINTTVYISRDFGVNWKKADKNLQLPSYMPASCYAQALVYNTTYKADEKKTAWKRMSPRAVKPVTEWETPFIYLFGGYDYSGGLFNSVWKGVINSLTFKPIQ